MKKLICSIVLGLSLLPTTGFSDANDPIHVSIQINTYSAPQSFPPPIDSKTHKDDVINTLKSWNDGSLLLIDKLSKLTHLDPSNPTPEQIAYSSSLDHLKHSVDKCNGTQTQLEPANESGQLTLKLTKEIGTGHDRDVVKWVDIAFPEVRDDGLFLNSHELYNSQQDGELDPYHLMDKMRELTDKNIHACELAAKKKAISDNLPNEIGKLNQPVIGPSAPKGADSGSGAGSDSAL